MTYPLTSSIALGSSKAGLTLCGQLKTTAGADQAGEISTGFSEMGNGFYQFYYDSYPDGFRGGVRIYESGVTGTCLGFIDINPEEAEYTDQKISTTESNIRGSDSDDLKVLSDQLDTAQADLDTPAQYKADVSGLVTEASIEGHIITGTAASLNTYDPPTKAELDSAVAGLAIEANVEGHVTTALNSYDPPTKAELDSAVAPLAIEANIEGHVHTGTTSALNAYDPPTKAELDSAVAPLAIEANVEGHVTTALNSYDPPTKAELDSAVAPLALEANIEGHVHTGTTSALNAYDPPTKTEMDSGFAGLNNFDPTSDPVIVGTMNQSALADFFNTDSGDDYNTSITGSVVKEIVDSVAGVGLTVAAIADGVWDEAKTGHTGDLKTMADNLNQSLSTTESNIRGSDSDDLKSLSDQLDTAQADLDSPNQYKADVSALAIEANVEGHVTNSLNTYDPPTKAEMDIGFAGLNNFDYTTEQVTVATNNDKTGYRLSATGVDDVLDEVYEGTLTLRHFLRLAAAALFGKSTGGGTNAPKFRDNADAKNRIDAVTDANGNRTSVTLDET